ncbi:hypothetical protein EPN15_03255 [Patescibacteria group bacterium]|nr:MAG: hypothetical protein EPN15_03255 [Patescibacteria group bacterium]
MITEIVKVGDWEIKVGESWKVPEKTIKDLEEFLSDKWKMAVMRSVKYPWWSISNRKMPSPIVRVDLSPLVVGFSVKDCIYEVEVRPAGLGITTLLLVDQRSRWSEALSDCGGIIKCPDSSIQDDFICADLLSIPYSNDILSVNGKGPYWIRSDKFHFEDSSLVPIRDDGNKQYLVDLKMAQIAVAKNLDWEVPFVIKPLQGARCREVEVFLPSKMRKECNGFSTQTRVLKTLARSDEPFIVQSFIPPKKEIINGESGWVMWRIFFGWIDGYYQCVGGLWFWRPNLKIHGASDSICGPLR